MKYQIVDEKYHFVSAFDTDTGACVDLAPNAKNEIIAWGAARLCQK